MAAMHISNERNVDGPKAWRFSTRTIEPTDKIYAWRDAMRRLRLPVGAIEDPEGFEGQVSCQTSPLGIQFARVRSQSQEISGDYPAHPEVIWLTMPLSGTADLIDGETVTRIGPGDVMFGRSGSAPASLRFYGDFEQLVINAPRLAISPRLIAPLTLRLGVVREDGGIASVFSAMLRATAQSLDELTPDQLRPIELALTEFLIACLARQDGARALAGAVGTKAAHMHKICQTIETMLGDPDLTAQKVADSNGVSLRYLQKLFAGSGLTFVNYLRTRRLERCRADIASPLYAHQSITQICFRWGFNSSSHFSRAFRDQYGVSPREYRRIKEGQGKRTGAPDQEAGVASPL